MKLQTKLHNYFMGISFHNYVKSIKINNKIEEAAKLIIDTKFPIKTFYEVIIHTPPRQQMVVIEGFWGDAAKGAGVGALAGGLGGGVPGALIGGGVGALGGAAKHIGQGIQKWWNPNAYMVKDFAFKEKEILELLYKMKELPEFEKILDKLILSLNDMKKQKVEEKPQATPQESPSVNQPSETEDVPHMSVDKVSQSSEFTKMIEELKAFTSGFAHTNIVGENVKKIAKFVSNLTKTHSLPELLNYIRQDLIFANNDPGFSEFESQLRADTLTNNEDIKNHAREFYFIAKLNNLAGRKDQGQLIAFAKELATSYASSLSKS